MPLLPQPGSPTMKALKQDNRAFIVWLFMERCAVCGEMGTEVNEIVPRARTKDALNWQNQVFLCHKHHVEFHHNGVTGEKIQQMTQQRADFLTTIGRKDWI